MKTELMQAVLGIGGLLVLLSFWRSHKDKNNTFDLFDLIMENGRVSKIAVGYMVVLGVSTWIVVNQDIHGRLTGEVFMGWLAAWVTPIITRMAIKPSDKPEDPK